MDKLKIKCLKCGSPSFVKNGFVFGHQRYHCKKCGYQFTKNAPAGKSIFIKLIAHTLYLSGLSMRQVAPIVGVTTQSVSRWIKKWHPAYMSEVGDKSLIYHTNIKTLSSDLGLTTEDTLMVVSTKLPSGAICHSIIQLPTHLKKTLKE